MASGYMKALYKDCKENKMTLHYNSTVVKGPLSKSGTS